MSAQPEVKMSEQVRDFYAKEIDFDNGPVKCVLKSDYDALHAEAEALRAQVSALQTDANSWQSGYDKGREDGAKAAEGWKAQHARDSAELRRLCAERDALRAENGRMNAQFNECARLFVDATEQACEAQRVRDALAVELEAARGLLQHLASVMAGHDQAPEEYNALAAARDFTATPAPEVPDHTERNLEMVEQGERQEAVAEYQQLSRYGNWDRVDKAVYDLGKLGDTPDKFRALYTTPQPGPDVRVLVAALEPFADFIAGTDPAWSDDRRISTLNYDFTKLRLGLFRKAVAALAAWRQAQHGGSHES